MTRLDFSPLFRSVIGADRLTDLLDTAMQADSAAPAYPPYNIEKTGDDRYRISIALAGFNADDLEIVAEDSTLTVVGKTAEPGEPRTFIHRGIAARSFRRRFQLADYVRVTEARLENGLLHIDLAREIPEAKKPRRIEVVSTQPAGSLRRASAGDTTGKEAA